MVGMVEKMFGVEIGFGQWMMFGVPLSIAMIAISWVILTKFLFPMGNMKIAGGDAIIKEEIGRLGVMSSEEKKIVVVGGFVAAFWLARGFMKKAPFILDLMPNLVTSMTLPLVSLSSHPVRHSYQLQEGEFLLDWKTAVKSHGTSSCCSVVVSPSPMALPRPAWRPTSPPSWRT